MTLLINKDYILKPFLLYTHTHTHTYMYVWVREVYNPAQTLSGPMARAEEVSCRGRVNDGQGKGERLRSYPVLGTPELRWEDQRPNEGYPQTAP